MNCNENEKLIQRYFDGELDVTLCLQLEEHLAFCKICSQSLANLRSLQQTFRSQKLYYSAPAGLEIKLSQIAKQGGLKENDKKRGGETEWRTVLRSLLRPAFSLPMIAVVILASLLFWRWNSDISPSANLLAQEALDNHLRALATNHLVDVASSNQHTVKPWFAGKLDFTPPVENFEGQGFLLLGGNLEYLNGRSVAGLTYQHLKHHIHLSIWTTSKADARSLHETRQGFHLNHWVQSGMEFWLISDMNAADLEGFGAIYRARLSSNR